MSKFHSGLRSRKSQGFTLIELMLATGLGLMLLVGLVQIIAMVNTTFADTRVLIDLQNRCRSAQMLLQQDLSHISVTPQAPRPVQMDDGYLSLGSVSANVRNENKLKRGNLWLVDTDLIENSCDYAAFTVFNRENPFTFTDPNNSTRTIQTPYAEVVWFVFQNDLYRVMVPFVNSPETTKNYYGTGTGSSDSKSHITSSLPTVRMISPGVLGDFPNRLMNYGTGIGNFIWTQCSVNPTTTLSRQLSNCMVLPNVISFKVQIWDPWQECYYDLEDLGNSNYYDRKTFVYPGLNTTSNTVVRYDSGSTLSYVGSSVAANEALGTYENAVARTNSNFFNPGDANDYYRPPTTSFLPGMRILVRAFDPDSGTVREFRVGHEFRTH